MKFSVLSEYIEQILAGTVDLSRATYDAQQAVLKRPKDEEKPAGPAAAKEEEVDEIQIGDAGYGGFNPHEGVDLEELMKLSGGFNPHAGQEKPAAKKGTASSSSPGAAATEAHSKDEL